MTYDPASGQPPPPPSSRPSPPPAPRKRRGCLPVVAIGLAGLVALVIAVALVGGGDDTSDEEIPETTSADGDTTPTAPADGQEVYAIGETARTADLDVTVHQVQNPYQPTNELETPQAGNRFVAVEAELANSTDEPIVWSSAVNAELTDSENRPYTVALAGTDLPQLDGDVPAADARRGWIVFEVPQDATGLQLRIKGSATATGSVFDLGG